MIDKEEYILTIPIISGILAIIAILTPALYGNTFFSWIWGLNIVTYGSSYIYAAAEPLTLYLGFLATLLILIGGGILIITVYRFKKHFVKKDKLGLYWIISGFLIIGGVLFYLIIQLIYMITAGNLTLLIPGFGIIGTIISSALAFVGGLLYRKKLR